MQNDINSAIAALQQINQVEGFDPMPLAVEYTDLNTQEKRKRLPVQVQMGWFRLKYPTGKISVTVQPGKDYFVAHARIYASFNDPPENFLAEASATRGKDPTKPTVSPREWSQTAAIGIALRNAGFGLPFDAAGDAFDHPAVDENADIRLTAGTGVTAVPPIASPAVADVPFGVAAPQAPAPAASAVAFPEQPAPSLAAPEQPAVPSAPAAPAASSAPADPSAGPQSVGSLEEALVLPCPIKQHAGKTLGEVLQIDPDCISWIATKYKNDPKIADGAKLICEHAMEQASA